MAEHQGWHLSKSVPISLIFVLVLQFAGGVYMIAQMGSNIATNAETGARNAHQISTLNGDVRQVRDKAARQAIELGKIGTSLENIEKQLDRISRLLEGQKL